MAWKGQAALDLSTVQTTSAIVTPEKLMRLVTPAIEVPQEVRQKPPSKSWEDQFKDLTL